MRWPHYQHSIRYKLMLVTLLTAGLGLLLATVAFTVYDLFLLRQSMRVNLTVLADVAALNSTAALQFQNPKDAVEVLGAMQAKPEIVAAALYDQQGRLFARYSRAAEPEPVPARVGEDGWKFGRNRLTVFRPVLLDHRRIGTVYLHSNTGERVVRLRLYATTGLGVLVATLLVTLAVSSRVNQIITRPILALARTAHIITESKNYSVRAERFSHDELGQLTDSFNQMLAAVESREDRLREAYNALVKENSDRQRAEEALRAAEQFKTLLLDSLPAEIAVLDSSGTIVTVNQPWLYFATLNGTPALRSVGVGVNYLDTCRHSIRDGDVIAEKALAGIEAVLQGQRKEFQLDYPCHSPNDQRWFVLHVVPAPNPQGGAIIAHHNITAQKKAEEELRRYRNHLEDLVAERTAELQQANAQLSREVAERKAAEEAVRHERDRAQTYLDVAGVMLVVITPDQKVRLINHAGCALLGRPEHEILGQNWFELFLPADQRETVRTVFHRLMAGEQRLVEHYENPVVTSSGEKRLISWHNILLRNPRGEIQGVISSGEDVTDRRRAEQRLRETAAALARSNKELEQFAYVASHDLREPLRMVASYVQLLERRYQGQLDAEADQFIHFAVDGAKRMQALIDDLLQYARLETRAKPFAPVDCNSVIEVVLRNLQIAVAEARATVDVGGSLPIVPGDDTQLTQLFQNLVGNALKFRREDALPRVKITAHRKEHDWLFSVEDNGIGIEPQYYDRIFVIFQRLHGREQYPGTGIGLALCKKIVERHGGQIWVESVPNHGSTFYFTIPAVGEGEI
jgi:PAS domain S-box-containing protein